MMNRKIIGFFICMLMLIAILPTSTPVTISSEQTAVVLYHQPPRYDKEWDIPEDIDRYNLEKTDFGFLGVNFTGWTPPDPIIATGLNHLVVMTNGAIAFFQKDGTMDFQDEIEDSFGFWGEVGATNFVFDPEVIYDPHTDRFMAMACERAPGSKSYFLLAISDDTDPNGMWHKYRIDVTALAGGDIDSPNIAVDSQTVYLTADFFTGGQKYLVYILEKEPLLSGSIGETRDMLIIGSQSYGIPVTYGDTPAMYMIEHFESSINTKVRLHAITDPLGSPQRETYDLDVPSYSPPEDPPQMGTSSRPETFDSRFWSCVWRGGSLWATHHQGSSRVMARWYEIKTNEWPSTGEPELIQSGDIDPGPNIRTFFTAITADGYGNAGMCFARSSPNEYISIARCTRLADDPLGTMRDVVIVKNSSAPYNGGRWGDYSGISCDPSDDITFWTHGEYTPGENIWNTWISRFTSPNQPPDPPSDPDPENDATDIDVNADLSWTCSDPDGDDLVYDVYFEANDPEPDELVSDDQTETTFDPGEMEKGVTYYWQIIVKDEHGASTSGSVWSFTTKENTPPNTPTIDGPNSGKPGLLYPFIFNAVDPDDDDVRFIIDWDDTNTNTTDVVGSGQDIQVSHTWTDEGTYTITAKAEDTNGLIGPEATFEITMPRDKVIQNTMFQWFLEQFPILIRLL